MRLLPIIFLLAFAPLGASPVVLAPETIIADPVNDPAWRSLFDQLSPEKPRLASFEERRTFPFRKKPVVLTGELRLSPDRGLSLHYGGDKPQIVVVDTQGVLLRDERGRERAAPSDGRAETATTALFTIIRFDLARLARDFAVHGLRDGDAWTLGFVPRDPTVADLLGSVVVQGRAGRLDRIDMVKSEKQRIEIILGETREDVMFSPAELTRFFR